MQNFLKYKTFLPKFSKKWDLEIWLSKPRIHAEHDGGRILHVLGWVQRLRKKPFLYIFNYDEKFFP